MNKTFGAGIDQETTNRKNHIQYINLKLAALGYPCYQNERTSEFLDIAEPLIKNYQEQNRLLADQLAPIGYRIQSFLNDYLKDVTGEELTALPRRVFDLDIHGLARIMSLPPHADVYETDIVKTYKTAQGVLHNPKQDKRTTRGVFHICEGGLPIPNDKKAVPKATFAKLLKAALNPPAELMTLPFTADQEEKARLFVSLLLRPVVVPEIQGITREKSMEVCFLAPGNLIGNLDFVESIFGNAGNPYLPENDASLDADGWTGHSGLVILATHLIGLKKKDLGLPHFDQATERQRKDEMYWKTEDELYNNGQAFKITARDERGAVITIIADNYFGYCKKEVKTMISYSANLYGLAEEEHAGGAIAFPTYDLGERFHIDERVPRNGFTFKTMSLAFSDVINVQPEGYGIDKNYGNIFYIPENSVFNIFEQSVCWVHKGKKQFIRLAPENIYVYPSGYRVSMRKRLNGKRWHLTGTVAEGTLCHKPCTVSGGGKSEISKSIKDAMIQGSVIVSELPSMLDEAEKIINMDFSKRLKNPPVYTDEVLSRKILDPTRTLGSVIKLLTPSEEYTDEYNQWLETIPQRIKDLIYIVKRRYHHESELHWRDYFSVDRINGVPGNELKYDNIKLISNYLRVGHDVDQSWRIFKVRQDFYPAEKLQVEDDITASIVVSADRLSDLNPAYTNPSVKLLINCEYRLFQRPDDAIIKGYDKQAEIDLSSPNTFLSNFEPLEKEDVQKIKEDTIGFDFYTQPVKDLIDSFLKKNKTDYLVVPSEPRLVDGVPSANPRYLQVRPDLVDPENKYIAEICTRIFRKVSTDRPLFLPVNAVLPGRRNNPADIENNVPPLAVFNPIHYQELPELFIDFICSVTGKSPSTTGFGSEGALTKGPFNNLLVASDLNNAFLSYVLTDYEPLTTAAGYVGPKYKVNHDVSLLIPELISRMSVEERKPKFLIEHGYMEKIENFEYKGKLVEASLLGYRITHKFATHFLGRIFSNPEVVFTPEMLRPELQDMDTFVESMKNLTITQKVVAEGLMTDGTYEALCYPLQVLLKIMVDGNYEGKDRLHSDIRKLFTKDYVLTSSWYRERLFVKQQRDSAFWTSNIRYLENIMEDNSVESLDLSSQLELAKKQLAHTHSAAYIDELVGTIGADPLK